MAAWSFYGMHGLQAFCSSMWPREWQLEKVENQGGTLDFRDPALAILNNWLSGITYHQIHTKQTCSPLLQPGSTLLKYPWAHCSLGGRASALEWLSSVQCSRMKARFSNIAFPTQKPIRCFFRGG